VARSRGEAEAVPETAAAAAPSSEDLEAPPSSEDLEAPPSSEDIETVFADGPYGAGSVEPPEDGSVPAGYEIKGNADSMLYHEPGSPFYDATKAEVFFATADDAERAGFARPASAGADREDDEPGQSGGAATADDAAGNAADNATNDTDEEA
jgi:hypothetical protein